VEPLTVTRSVTIATDLDQVWGALATTGGLAGWLGGAFELDPDPGVNVGLDPGLTAGAVGWFTDDRRRRVVVREVRPGARLAFTWWPEGDADAASSVVVELTTDDGDATRVTVTETLDPAAARGGRVALLADATVADLGHGWSGRLEALAERLSPVPAWA
jgi:uncharacterized protein YndB with AHSA1/START domain